MEFGTGFWAPIVATLAMLLGAFIAWLVLAGSRRLVPRTPSKDKNRTYGCGEKVDPEETQVDSKQFFSPIRRFFGKFYQYVLPGHSGNLSTYLIWVVSGIVLVFIWIILEVG